MRRRLALPLPLLLLLCAGAPADGQRRSYSLGGDQHPWVRGGDGVDPELLVGSRFNPRVDTTNTPGDALDFEHLPGWIGPRFFDDQTNIAGLVLAEGASITAPNLVSVNSQLLRTQLSGIVNGDHHTAFQRKPTPFERQVATFGIWVVLDFGRLVGVQRVRFYPRNTVVETPASPYHNDFLRGYELYVNRTLTNTVAGSPDILVARDNDNTEPVVEVSFAPRYLRLIKLRSLARLPFEIDEIEVYGAGYLDGATYLSDLIDLGRPALPGRVQWRPVVVGDLAFSDLSVRVRTGLDTTVIRYQQVVRTADGVAHRDVPGSVYWELDRTDRVPLAEDTENWSPWQVLPNGGLITAPLPRRYVQFRFEFTGQLDATRLVDELFFDYLVPALGDTVRAEVYPRLAEPERSATFRYAVLYRRAGAGLGFDRLEIDTNAPVRDIRALRIDGRQVPFTVEASTDSLFRLAFPPVTRDGTVLEFTFDVPIFRFGTTFTGRAVDSRFPDVPQRLEPGQVVRFDPADTDELSGLTVAIPEDRIGTLLGSLRPSTRVLTPNGDGVNDTFGLDFNILQVLRPVPVHFGVWDLAGRRVGGVEARFGLGPGRVDWDGRRPGGAPVSPGLYVWRLEVRADTIRETFTGTVAVAY